jgi:hypothetical protein
VGLFLDPNREVNFKLEGEKKKKEKGAAIIPLKQCDV